MSIVFSQSEKTFSSRDQSGESLRWAFGFPSRMIQNMTNERQRKVHDRYLIASHNLSVQPSEAAMAIVRGAVMKDLEPTEEGPCAW